MSRWKKVRKSLARIRYLISQAWYWLRTHTWNRYHIIDCRSPHNDYKWGWCDRDYLMLCACFNILKDFVERELPHSYTDYSQSGAWQDSRTEILALYEWWMKGRATEHADAHGEAARLGLGDLSKLAQGWTSEMQVCGRRLLAFDARDDQMLARLVKVRGFMWS